MQQGMHQAAWHQLKMQIQATNSSSSSSSSSKSCNGGSCSL
jgi:hypothetical protein